VSAAFAVILVDSAGHAVRIEKLLRQYNITCKLIPPPRHLSSDCGVCVRIFKDDMETVSGLLKEKQISIQSMEVL
jgi:hypothetical protein